MFRRLLVIFLAVAAIVLAQTEKPDMFDRTTPYKPGDRCVVCGQELSEGDTVYLVEGQRVGVKEMMKAELFANPWQYLEHLKPRGGLFGGETAPEGGASNVWLLLGVYVLLGLVFAGLAAHQAVNTGRPAAPWLLAGLLFNVFAYIALLAKGGEARADPRYSGVTKIPSTAEPAACPNCSGLNHPAATVCSHCGIELSPASASEASLLRPAG